jgi:hypothetical protein
VLHSRSLSDNEYFLNQIGVDWYLDFSSGMSQIPDGAHKLPYIRVPTNADVWNSGKAQAIESLTEQEISELGFLTRAQLGQMAKGSPGSYWYLFGEPNRYGYITGARFAPVFHYMMTSIMDADPTARIVSPSILNWTWTCYLLCNYQQGKVWLQQFISAYETRYDGEKPPVDVWAIDTYPIDWVRTPNSALHASIVIDQLEGMRQYLNTIPEYANTPIWITEVAVHVGYDGWKLDPLRPACSDSSISDVRDCYRWDKMSDYVTTLLDWLDANAAGNKIEKWFFFRTWRDIVNASSDGYMGIIFFEGEGSGSPLNCLGETYRSRALLYLDDPPPKVKCDADGNTVPDG